MPGIAGLLESTDPAGKVTVDNQPSTRQGVYWHTQMDVNNAESNVFEEFQIVGVLNDQGSSGEGTAADRVGALHATDDTSAMSEHDYEES